MWFRTAVPEAEHQPRVLRSAVGRGCLGLVAGVWYSKSVTCFGFVSKLDTSELQEGA